MSAYVQVREYGEDIRVICTQCHLEQPEPLYKTANATARTHNATVHTNRIDWAA